MKEQIYLFLLDKKESQRTSNIAHCLGLSVYQARHYLMKLEAEGKIKRSPPRWGGHTSWAIVCQADKQG